MLATKQHTEIPSRVPSDAPCETVTGFLRTKGLRGSTTLEKNRLKECNALLIIELLGPLNILMSTGSVQEGDTVNR